jgi:hypothetical protein
VTKTSSIESSVVWKGIAKRFRKARRRQWMTLSVVVVLVFLSGAAGYVSMILGFWFGLFLLVIGSFLITFGHFDPIKQLAKLESGPRAVSDSARLMIEATNYQKSFPAEARLRWGYSLNQRVFRIIYTIVLGKPNLHDLWIENGGVFYEVDMPQG